AGQDSDGADIAFVISNSWRQSLDYGKLFVKEVMVKLAQNSTKIHAAVVTSGRGAVAGPSVKLNFTQKFNLQQFISAINKIRVDPVRRLQLNINMYKALEILTSERVFRSCRQHVPKIAILIVDEFDFYYNARLRNASERLKQEGVRIFVVYVYDNDYRCRTADCNVEIAEIRELLEGLVRKDADLVAPNNKEFDEMNGFVNNLVTKVLLAIGKN
ncbi:hypothetical protein OS493_039035, partial [Desmophyllum pertusum]